MRVTTTLIALFALVLGMTPTGTTSLAWGSHERPSPFGLLYDTIAGKLRHGSPGVGGGGGGTPPPSGGCPPSGVNPALVKYGAPGATGNGNTVGTPMSISSFLNQAQPGWTLCLAPGTYRTSNGGVLHPAFGRSGQAGVDANGYTLEITVAAQDESDPPLIDSEWSATPPGSWIMGAVVLSRVSYWRLIGINIRGGFAIGYAPPYQSETHHITFQRVVAWDGPIDTNSSACALFYATGPILFEDFACFGTGRKALAPTQDVGLADGSGGFTCRRCWVRAQGTTATGITSAQIVYNSYQQLWENLIVSMDLSQMPDSYGVSDNATVLCGPAYVSNPTNTCPACCPNAGDVWSFQAAGQAHRIDDSPWVTNSKLLGSLGYVLPAHKIQTNDLFQHSGTGITSSGLSNFEIKDVIAFFSPSNPRASAQWATNYAAPFNGGSNLAVTRVTHIGTRASSRVSPWVYTYAYDYATTAAMFSDGKSPWVVGNWANLCYEYENGVRQDGTGGTTVKPLWPWRMEARISQAFERAGKYGGPCGAAETYPCVGGFATTRTAFSVTSEVEQALGQIPPQCRR